jgi:hypothetical protein
MYSLLPILICCITAFCGAASLDGVLGAPTGLPPDVRQRLAVMPVVGEYATEELLRFDVRDRQIHPQIHLPPELASSLAYAPRDGLRLRIKGSSRDWTLRRIVDARFGRSSGLELAGFDQTGLEAFPRVSLTVGPGVAYIEGAQYPYPLRPWPAHVLLVVKNGPMRLGWFLPRSQSQPHNDWVRDWNELATFQPLIAHDYVEPVLRALGASHVLHRRPAVQTYQIFRDIPPDAEVARRVAALVERLDDVAPADRDAATAALVRMGRPAVLALLHTDRHDLSPEQSARIDRVLRTDDWRPLASLAAAADDRHVLTECLDDDDPAVRAAARARLEHLARRPISFETQMPAWARAAVVDRMLDSLSRADRLSSRIHSAD